MEKRFHGAVVSNRGGERSWIGAAVSRSMTAIGPPHLGQRQSGSDSWAVVSGSLGTGTVPRAMKHSGSRVERRRLARKPK